MSDAPHPFSPDGRQRSLEAMATTPLDLLIMGGGITGVGIARDAALRGWSVALVDKEDFGFGTSSRSSKIVHGGVRYLEYGHFLLVRESARERRVLQSIAVDGSGGFEGRKRKMNFAARDAMNRDRSIR